MLWISSIGILSIGQFALAINRSKKVTGALLSGWLVLVISIYSLHYYVGDNSLYSIHVGRESMFEEKCRVSHQNVYKKANDAKGVFFDPDWGARFKKMDSGKWYNDGVGVLGLGKLNSGFLLFYERINDRGRNTSYDYNPKYRRYELGNHEGVGVDHLSSEYAVITKPYDIPKQYGIYGAEIIIKDLRNANILATTAYVFDRIDRKFCGHAPSGRFSASAFIIDTLNLTKKYQSAHDK